MVDVKPEHRSAANGNAVMVSHGNLNVHNVEYELTAVQTINGKKIKVYLLTLIILLARQ